MSGPGAQAAAVTVARCAEFEVEPIMDSRRPMADAILAGLRRWASVHMVDLETIDTRAVLKGTRFVQQPVGGLLVRIPLVEKGTRK